MTKTVGFVLPNATTVEGPDGTWRVNYAGVVPAITFDEEGVPVVDHDACTLIDPQGRVWRAKEQTDV